MVISNTELVSSPESQLLETIQQVRFGEIYNVEVADDSKWIEYELTPAMRDLIGYIREGAQHIDILTVHNGQPTVAETDLELNGFRCRRKVKFPTA